MRALPVLFLAALAAAPAALADRLELTDGRVVEGTVTKEGEDYRVVSRFGEALLPAKEVAKWEKARPFDEVWRERLAALPATDLDGRAALARWLAESGRKAEAEATAALVLESDPEHAGAHEALGHVRFRGRWMSVEQSKVDQGLIRRGDAWYTPAEWELLDGAAKRKAEEAETLASARRRGESVNEAVRLMLAKDPALRAEGDRRLKQIAKESSSQEIETLAEQVRQYAKASDQMAAAVAAGPSSGSGRVVAETRIQMAKLKRPIQQIATSLASGPTGFPFSTNSNVIIQLPELEVVSVRTTTILPVD